MLRLAHAFRRGMIPLHHVTCGGFLCHIRNCPKDEVLTHFQRVAAHLIRQGWRCPRCKMALTVYDDVVPLWQPADEGVQPVERPDESGLIGFGPEYSRPD